MLIYKWNDVKRWQNLYIWIKTQLIWGMAFVWSKIPNLATIIVNKRGYLDEVGAVKVLQNPIETLNYHNNKSFKR